MAEICKGYCGVTCIDGGCPMALRDEYAERGYDVVHSCNECGYYKGCEDCAFDGTKYCIKDKPVREARWKGNGMGDYRCSYCDEVVSGNTLNECPNCKSVMN